MTAIPQGSTAVMARRVEALDSLDDIEVWKDIDAWDGYQVSDQGRVRSWKQPCAGRVWLPRYDVARFAGERP